MNNLSLSIKLPIIVAVSGGADSLCLLGTLHELGYSLIVAHFDHQLRSDSADDAKFVEEIAAQYQLPFLLGTTDVNAYAKVHKQTIEEAARNARYEFFFEQARLHKAQAVAVGHTADDQAETVLMHFLRGAGLNGLKGILPRTVLSHFDPEIPLVRPILDLWRVDTEAYCAAHGLVPREDPTNASQDYFRNRLRHTLIPELENYNPRFRETLVRTSHALQGDHVLLTEIIDQSWRQVITAEAPNYISFSLSSLITLSPALIRNIIKNGMEKLLPGQNDLSFSTLERAAALILDPNSSQRIDLASGLFLLKEADALHLTADEHNLPRKDFPQMESMGLILTLNSEPEIPLSAELSWDSEMAVGFHWKILIKIRTITDEDREDVTRSVNPFWVALDADVLGVAISFRTRKPGDKFCPLGMNGKSMKLQDFFINEKLPRRVRDRYPLLCIDGADEIVWIPGLRPAHRVRVTNETRRIVLFEFRRSDKQW